jgi:SAM-dependent methyltransferase
LERVRNTPLTKDRAAAFRLLHPDKPRYDCPVCGYAGPFMDAHDPPGLRMDAMCPSCSSLERHRLQWLALEALPERPRFSGMHVLHCAPEPAMRWRLRAVFGRYSSADLRDPKVDYQVDLRDLPFDGGSFDVVFASHVLEHIKEDDLALAEIRRILRPGGFAVLPVPVVNLTTVEYPKPNPREWGHVRAPGPDYFDRYERHFPRVRRYLSSEFDPRFQPFVYEDRSLWPPPGYPLRQRSGGTRHEDVVPVAYVSRSTGFSGRSNQRVRSRTVHTSTMPRP